MNHNGYFAVKLDKSWQDVITRSATMDVVRGDHITLAYKPDDIAFSRYTKLVGKRVNAYIDEYRKNENIEAFFVTDMFYDSYRLTESEKRLERVDNIISQAEDNVTNVINDYNVENDEQIEINTTDLYHNFEALKSNIEIMMENS